MQSSAAILLNQSLAGNVRLLKSSANKYAINGALIAVTAIIMATMVVAYQQSASINVEALLRAQSENMVLWLLDISPFLFAMWGQYAGSIMAYEASAMVLDQTNELRSQAVNLEHKAVYDTTHDGLTGLPNRVLLHDRMAQAVKVAARDKSKLAVLHLDLSNFKEVNNTMGHFNGDRLLKQVAARLAGVVRESDTVARVAGDEFVILLPKINTFDSALEVGKKVFQALESPFEIEDLSIGIHAGMGVAIYPDHGFEVDTLLQRADVAKFVAKKQGKTVVIYDPKQDQHSPRRLTLMGELRQAIEQNELILYFQPKLDLKQNRVTEVEALVRWQHPEHGFIGPDEFIPLAERTGLIKPLTIWVLGRALYQHGEWKKQGIDVGVAVNLSAQSLLDEELPDIVAGMLSSFEVPHDRLMLEITESAIMVDQARALEILNRLRTMGVSLSIDDFGTGYSSLAYLSKLPVSELKIDKSFVMAMSESKGDAVIVRTTIDLGHNLDLKVIAEGVETAADLAALRDLGCDCIQGYYISRPVEAEAFTAWVKDEAWKPLMANL